MAEGNKLRVGIIGTGIFAVQAHLPALKSLSDKIEIKACCNRSIEKAQDYAKQAGISAENVYSDMNQVLARDDIDAVVLCLPVQLNYTVTKLAVDANKHVIMEKPISSNLKEAQLIVDLSTKNDKGRVVAISENYFYKDIITEFINLFPKIGKIISFSYTQIRPFDKNSQYVATQWRQNPEHPGGYLSDGGVHHMTFITLALGTVDTISAFASQTHEINGADDTLVSVVRMTKGGVIGTIKFTYAPGGSPLLDFTVQGESGSISMKDQKQIVLSYRDKDGSSHKEEIDFSEAGDVRKSNEEGNKPQYKIDVRREFEDFYQVVNERRAGDNTKQTKASTAETFHHLAVIDAGIRSAKSGGVPVKVEVAN